MARTTSSALNRNAPTPKTNEGRLMMRRPSSTFNRSTVDGGGLESPRSTGLTSPLHLSVDLHPRGDDRADEFGGGVGVETHRVAFGGDRAADRREVRRELDLDGHAERGR